MRVTSSEPAPTVAPAWSLPPESRLVWSSWGSGHVVYQASSGETHYLNATGASVLRRLGESPGSLEDVCRHIEAAEGLPADETFAGQVAALLARFDELGLISRCDFPRGA